MATGCGSNLSLMRSSHSLRDYIGRWLVIGGLPRTYRGGAGAKNGKALTCAGGCGRGRSGLVVSGGMSRGNQVD